ncbi:MAG: amidohydrolase family protein [Acidimicrobiales bacterium]
MSNGVFDGLCVIDADTHLTEPHDLWSSRAPARWRDRLPKVVEVGGWPTWVCDGVVLQRAGASGVVDRAGAKVPGTAFMRWSIDDVHPGAYSVPDRLAMMDEQGVWAHVVYPNTVGFGGQRFAAVADTDLRRLAVEIYNDAMAGIQEESGGRLLPMGVVPSWDAEVAVAEVERIAGLGLHGLNATSSPQDHGLPDLGSAYWDPVWESAAGHGLPVNFHIGASDSAMEWFGSVSWPSLTPECRLGLGSAMLYLNNAGVVANLIYAGVLDRHPDLQLVTVESGVGWIPFLLAALDYQLAEIGPAGTAHLELSPSEYFRRQFHACFWFERTGVAQAAEALGWDRLMFETDYPHPTCLYPDALGYAAAVLADVGEGDRRAVMGENAARLYRVTPPVGTPR